MIHARGLVKTFGSTPALDRFDMDVSPGQVHGFLGPNGAGKSTTIRTLLGQVRLDAGELQVMGRDPRRDVIEIHSRLAYVPGDVVLWPHLTGGETLDLLGALHPSDNPTRRRELIDAFDLDVSKKGRSYSKGNRQKVALVSALSTDVDLYVFDEPTSGLDPLMESVFQDLVRERVQAGATILLSSHILDEVDTLCSHVTIIREGQRVMHGSLEKIRSSALTRVEVRGLPSDSVRHISSLPGVTECSTDGQHLHVSVHPDHVNSVVGWLTGQGPTSLTVRPPSLDEVFHSHYEGTQ